jgi:hypothetical protein
MSSSPTLSHPKTVRNALKESGFYSATKKKTPLLNEPIANGASSLQYIMKTGPWRIGKGFYRQMRQKSIGLGQMERFISGKKGENHFLMEHCQTWRRRKPHSMGLYEVEWSGKAHGGAGKYG